MWSVDVTGARGFLTDVVNTLSNPPDARRTHDYLSDKKVKGTLLRPVLPVLNRADGWRVMRPNWAAQTEPGVLHLRGTVMLAPTSAGPAAAALPFEFRAEFRGTPEGTVLAVLDVKEAE